MTELLCKKCNIRYTLNVRCCHFCDSDLEVVRKQKFRKRFKIIYRRIKHSGDEATVKREINSQRIRLSVNGLT